MTRRIRRSVDAPFTLTDEQKMALYLLIRYDHAQNGAHDFDGPDPGYTEEQLKTFLRRRTMITGMKALFEKYRNRFIGGERFYSHPPHIRDLAKCAFSYSPSGLIGEDGRIDNILNRITAQHKEKLERFNERIVGVFNIYRYAAHIDEDFKAGLSKKKGSPPVEGDATLSGPQIVKAAIEIKPREIGTRFPRFLLHYRGKGKDSINTAVGSVVLIDGGRHIMMFGEDRKTHYPLYIVANYDGEMMRQFNGLVIRLHDTGVFFASRVHFRRTEKKLLDLGNDIRPFPEHDPQIQNELQSTLHMIANVIQHDEFKTTLHMYH